MSSFTLRQYVNDVCIKYISYQVPAIAWLSWNDNVLYFCDNVNFNCEYIAHFTSKDIRVNWRLSEFGSRPQFGLSWVFQMSLSPGNTFQLLLGDHKASPGQMGFIIPPASSGSTLGSPPSWERPESPRWKVPRGGNLIRCLNRCNCLREGAAAQPPNWGGSFRQFAYTM